jgi:hypothetical protein
MYESTNIDWAWIDLAVRFDIFAKSKVCEVYHGLIHTSELM